MKKIKQIFNTLMLIPIISIAHSNITDSNIVVYRSLLTINNQFIKSLCDSAIVYSVDCFGNGHPLWYKLSPIVYDDSISILIYAVPYLDSSYFISHGDWLYSSVFTYSDSNSSSGVFFYNNYLFEVEGNNALNPFFIKRDSMVSLYRWYSTANPRWIILKKDKFPHWFSMKAVISLSQSNIFLSDKICTCNVEKRRHREYKHKNR